MRTTTYLLLGFYFVFHSGQCPSLCLCTSKLMYMHMYAVKVLHECYCLRLIPVQKHVTTYYLHIPRCYPCSTMRLTSFHHIVSHTLTCLSMTVSSEAPGPHWPWHSRVDRWRAHLQCLPSGQGATKVTSWITCDGDIDPGWIESLNSVLGREKGHSGWYWVVRITHYMCQQEGKRNHGLVTTSTSPWSGSCLLGTRWWSWMALHMYTRHRVHRVHRLCGGWSEGWLASWHRS